MRQIHDSAAGEVETLRVPATPAQIEDIVRAACSGALVAPLHAETYDAARAAAPGWDVYYLEREWREWIVEPPRDADAAFVGFCRKWFEKRGSPE